MLPLRMNCSVLRVLVPALTLLMPAVADKGQTADTRSELAKLLSQLEWARLQGDEERVEAAYQRLSPQTDGLTTFGKMFSAATQSFCWTCNDLRRLPSWRRP